MITEVNLMTVDEVAARLSIRKVTLYSYLNRGLFPGAVKVNDRWDIPAESVENFVPPKGVGEVSRGAPPLPDEEKVSRSDIMLDCTATQAAFIRSRLTAQQRYAILAYYAGLDYEGLKAELERIGVK